MEGGGHNGAHTVLIPRYSCSTTMCQGAYTAQKPTTERQDYDVVYARRGRPVPPSLPPRPAPYLSLRCSESTLYETHYERTVYEL